MNRRAFYDQLCGYFKENIQSDQEIPDWTKLFRSYAERPESDKVIVIDNLELLITADSNFPRTLRNAWEKILKTGGRYARRDYRFRFRSDQSGKLS